MKKVYDKNGITLYNGDCLQIMDDLIKKGIKVDAIITDPPYGIFGESYKVILMNMEMKKKDGAYIHGKNKRQNFSKYVNVGSQINNELSWDTAIPFNEMWLRLQKIRAQLNSKMILFGNDPFAYKLKTSNEREFKYSIIWDKMAGGIGLYAKHQPIKQFEEIMVFYNSYNYAEWVKDYFNELLKLSGKTVNFFKERWGKVCEKTGKFKLASTVSHYFTGGYQFSLMPKEKYDDLCSFVDGDCKDYAELKAASKNSVYNPQMVKRDKKINQKEGLITGYGLKGVTGSKIKLEKIYTHKYPTNIWQFKKVSAGAKHPTQKPLDLMRYLIKTFTNEGDTILDFTSGSGTTLIAAKLENRKAIGIEISKKYCDITIERLKENYEEKLF